MKLWKEEHPFDKYGEERGIGRTIHRDTENEKLLVPFDLIVEQF